ncbi:MAG: UDP-N-acetylglucosamine 1-carboxyvinyltransferase [Tissierellia bacterium]|nr:UDP-N-acetylglucosamine 1-carboxyvinyltransferase [Tissierellia bacterium]
MEKFVIHGTGPLEGSVRISGAKNAALPIMCATILTKDKITLEDVPELKDVTLLTEVLRGLGVKIEHPEPNTYIFDASEITNTTTGADLMSKMRASFCVMGPLIGRMGRTENSLPGGCAIGTRPIDLHLKGFRALGCSVRTEHGMVCAKTDHLKGSTVYLDFPSVGATENIMMAAVLADGETTIDNAAMEPEIVDLSNFLNKMGAQVRGAGTSTIKIKGVKELHGCRHQIIPDRIEAGTYMVAVAATGGNINIENVITSHMRPVIAKLKEAGVEIYENGDTINVISNGTIESFDIKTLPYPGMPTDMQAQFMALATLAKGTSVIIETVFENRFMHVDELNRMGANIRIDGKNAIVQGVHKLRGGKVRATDLRCGAALVIAALTVDGKTEIEDIYHIERGYENLIEKLEGLGAHVVREG